MVRELPWRGLTACCDPLRGRCRRLPTGLRRGPWRRAPSPPGSVRALTSQLGVALGVAFAVCFLTGLLSHSSSTRPAGSAGRRGRCSSTGSPRACTSRPAWRCSRCSAAKLWSVYPKLFRWPPVRDPAHALERLGVAVLVAAALFQLVTGLLNIALLVLADAVRLHRRPLLDGLAGDRRAAAARRRQAADHPRTRWAGPGTRPPGRRRRAQPAGAARRRRRAPPASITVATVGQTVRPLRRLSVLAPRRPDVGPQGLPVNRTAAGGRRARAVARSRLPAEVVGPARTVRAHPRRPAGAAAAHRCAADHLRRGLERDRAPGPAYGCATSPPSSASTPDRAVAPSSRWSGPGLYRTSTVDAAHAARPADAARAARSAATAAPRPRLPGRLIAPNRPGVLQTKWVGRITLRDAP